MGPGCVYPGYLFTYFNTKKTDERKAQIDRANDQVRLLYGPLLACISATRSAYAAMVRQHSPDGTTDGFVKAIREWPDGPEGNSYRHWMKSVLQPLNERAADIIINHLNLLESSNIDPVLLQFVAHVSSYRVILNRWEDGATAEWSAVSYPDKLPQYVEREFKKIKRKQADLLGIKKTATTEAGEAGGKDINTGKVPLHSKL
ncbi:hypothetical protein NADE_003513 [Nannochloris sp. 'desiccata']|nr:hypothetical protein NADE_003513 [Chlorella desiccata (nom. nud.)]